MGSKGKLLLSFFSLLSFSSCFLQAQPLKKIEIVDPPQMGGDFSLSTLEDEPVAGNIHLLSQPSMTAVSLIPPQNGELILDPVSGLFTYTPDPDYNGLDTFTYGVNTLGGESLGTGTVSISISSVNDGPLVTSNTGAVFSEGGSSGSLFPAINVSDVDHVAAELRLVITGVPIAGELQLNGLLLSSGSIVPVLQLQQGALRYVHNGGETLIDSFTYHVSDLLNAKSSDFSFNLVGQGLNDPPLLVNMDSLDVFVSESSILTSDHLLITDEEQGPGSITYVVQQIPQNGFLEVNGLPLSNGQSFTQSDINGNRVIIRHDGFGKSSDQFVFNASDGQGGLIPNTSFTISYSPNPITERIVKISVSQGGNHSCAVSSTGRVKCWGRNTDGQLGINSTVNHGNQANQMGDHLPDVILDEEASDVAAGYLHTCALLKSGKVKCWGDNAFGQLGKPNAGSNANIGDQANEMESLQPVDLGNDALGLPLIAKAISVGYYSSCVITSEDLIKCWGRNSVGQLGLGHTINIGPGANDMGDNLQIANVNNTVKRIASGAHHSCAILNDDSVKCWGYNIRGQLGYGDTQNRGDNINEMAQNLLTVDLGPGRSAKAISAGEEHTCALMDNDNVKCWGRNSEGQLGLGHTHHKGDQANEMGNNLNIAAMPDGRRVISIDSGIRGNCAILDDQSLRCWGYNTDGSLGMGNSISLGDNAGEMGNALPALNFGPNKSIHLLSSGRFSSCVLSNFFHLQCWGANYYGALGLGDTAHRGDNPGEMGINLPEVDALGSTSP